MQTQNHPLHKAVEQLKSMDKIDIHGKQYASVASRVEAFRANFPSATIETVLVHDDEQRVVIQAKITIDGTLVATGYAEELRGEGWINSTSALENAETSAIGRSLASYGLSGSEYYASSNEVTNAVAQQEQTKLANNYKHQTHSQQATQSYKTPYQNSQDFQQLTSLGISLVTKGDKITLQGDKSTIINNKELLKSLGFRFDFNGTKEWYMMLRQAA